MKKRILASFLSLVLVLSLVPMSALAAEEQNGPETPVCAELAGCTEDAHDPACPLYVAPGGDDNTYYEFEDVTTLGTPTALTTQADDGMSGNCGAADSESSVTWALTKNSEGSETPTYTLTISGSGAMGNYSKTSNKTTAPWGTANVTSVVIENGVTMVGQYCFYNMESVTSVSFPQSLKEILAYSFEGTSLTSVDFPTDLEAIRGYAFRNIKTLTSVSIPDSVTTLGNRAFQYDTALASVTIGKGISKIDQYTFSGCSALTSITIPSNVTELVKYAFAESGLTSASIPNSITTIPEGAFNKCSSLASVTMTGSVTSVGKSAFSECTALKTVTWSNNLTEIGELSFNASGLETVTLPDSVKTIGEKAFTNCKSLKSINLGTGLTTIGESAFQGNVLTSVKIPANVTSIGANAFNGKTADEETFSLSTIDASEALNLTAVGGGAFNNLGTNAIIYVNSQGVADCFSGGTTHANVVKIAITNGGTFAPDTAFTSGTLATPTKDGAVFEGWYENSNFSGEKVTSTTDTTTTTFYAKWIDLKHNGITLEYGSTSSDFPTIEGVSLNNWTSADTSIVQIEDEQLKAVGVGTTTITASAALATRSGETLTVDVTVTPMPITFGTGDGENPNSTITYQYTGMAPEFSDFATFYPAKVVNGQVSIVEDSKAVTLTDGTDIVFVYDAGAGEQQYDYLPINVTDNQEHGIEVTVKLVNKNYRFVTATNATLSDSIKENVIVTAEGKTEVSIIGLPAVGENPSYAYTGKAIAPIGNLTRISAGTIDKFTVHFHPWGDTDFDEAHLTDNPTSELTPEAIANIAPTEPGSYLMIVDGTNDTQYVYQSWIFTITKATVTIRPNDKSAYVGDAVPALGENDYTVTGLVGDDTLTTKPTLAYDGTPDMSKADTYAIKASGAEANEEHYTLVYEDGTLTVSRRSSGGGGGSSSSSTTTETERNPDGSTTTTVTDKKTGTVTETTKFKDGSTLVVETKKDGTITTTETAKNGVKVRTVDEPGEDVTATVTIPRSVGEAVVTIPADVDYGMVAVDADTGEIVKLSVPTEDGMTVKLDGSAELVLVDRSLDFTDTNGHWAEDAIDFATAHELFAGTSDTTFSPDSSMTRAMLMTVLARFDGQDTTGGAVWYEKAMAWAKENGISDGSNPDGNITREQFATMLWRYAGSPAVSGMALNEFGDSASVNGYAVDAMRWAVSNGIIGGTDAGLLMPQGNATRAQVATMLMRFVEGLTK